MQELRRIRTGALDENDNMVSLHDVLDARYQYENENDGNVFVCIYIYCKQTNGHSRVACMCVYVWCFLSILCVSV